MPATHSKLLAAKRKSPWGVDGCYINVKKKGYGTKTATIQKVGAKRYRLNYLQDTEQEGTWDHDTVSYDKILSYLTDDCDWRLPDMSSLKSRAAIQMSTKSNKRKSVHPRTTRAQSKKTQLDKLERARLARKQSS